VTFNSSVKAWWYIYVNHSIINFPQNVSVKKKFENRSIFGEDMDKKLRLTFWATPYTYPNTSLFVAYPYIAQSE